MFGVESMMMMRMMMMNWWWWFVKMGRRGHCCEWGSHRGHGPHAIHRQINGSRMDGHQDEMLALCE